MIEIERYINFIVKNKLTQSQFVFLYLLQRKRYDLLKLYAEANPSTDGTAIGKVLRDDLLARGFIIKLDEREVANSYQIGQPFKLIFVDKFEAANELKELYPDFMISKGTRYPLTVVDVYELAPLYGERIGYEYAEHEEVKKDIAYAIDQNLISCKLENFVRSEFWKPLRKARLGTAVQVESDEINF